MTILGRIGVGKRGCAFLVSLILKKQGSGGSHKAGTPAEINAGAPVD